MTGLVKARKSAGMTMTELARRAGVSVISIYRYEHGMRKPTSEILLRMAQALNVTMEDLLRG